MRKDPEGRFYSCSGYILNCIGVREKVEAGNDIFIYSQSSSGGLYPTLVTLLILLPYTADIRKRYTVCTNPLWKVQVA